MSLNERVVELTVTMQLKPAQAIAVAAMFDHWNYLSSVGSDRYVAFYVAGDGDFHPKCQTTFSVDPMSFNQNPEQTLESLKKMAKIKNSSDAHPFFDFDSIAWNMHVPQPPETDPAKIAEANMLSGNTQTSTPPTDMVSDPIVEHQSEESYKPTPGSMQSIPRNP